ncbi:MAG: hypothetical protein ACLPWF_30485 [Bryobacteraceae bacterium]
MSLQPDIRDLRRHYASLSDDELLALERSDLTEIAQRAYDDEIAKRKIAPADDVPETATDDEVDIDSDSDSDEACACSFDSYARHETAPDLEEACKILEQAKIPCHVNIREEVGASGNPQYIQEVMVPAASLLHALSVLDKEMFNPRQEAEWRAHFETMSDEDFRTIKIEDLTAGMLDRAERLKNAFREEQVRRSR